MVQVAAEAREIEPGSSDIAESAGLHPGTVRKGRAGTAAGRAKTTARAGKGHLSLRPRARVALCAAQSQPALPARRVAGKATLFTVLPSRARSTICSRAHAHEKIFSRRK